MSGATKRKSRRIDHRDLSVSFEFFPPKTEKMEDTLWQSIRRLAPLRPDFVSVTYGAGGSTRERTHATVARVIKETNLKPAAHLTCVGARKEDIDEVIRDYWDAGVRHIVALRGDSPEGAGKRYEPFPGGYQSSVELIEGIKAIGDFEVSVAAYPEKHPDSPNEKDDIDMLKAKVDAGASRAITQFFFNNDYYYRYLDKVRARGIDVPVTPGIVPFNAQVAKFATACGATIPDWFAHRFEGLEGDPETAKLVSAAMVVEQVMDLVDHGITNFHFYTLNRADLVYAICHMLGMREEKDRKPVKEEARNE
ncbi:MAG: methylenetetrahydrofolate reductase [NAD(P)H] [Cellvibrionaceae bacterium]